MGARGGGDVGDVERVAKLIPGGDAGGGDHDDENCDDDDGDGTPTVIAMVLVMAMTMVVVIVIVMIRSGHEIGGDATAGYEYVDDEDDHMKVDMRFLRGW